VTWACSSHGADAIEPLTPLSPLLEPRVDAPSCVSRRTAEPPRPLLRRPRERPPREMTWDVFCRQGPFVGSGGPYSPGPVTAPPLLEDDPAPEWRLSHHPGPWPVSQPMAAANRLPTLLHATPIPTVLPADTSSALGPRSLASAPFSRVRSAGLFEARRRHNDFCNCITTYEHYPELRILAGRRPQPPSVSRDHAVASLERKPVTTLRAVRVPPRAPLRRFAPGSRSGL